MAGKKVWAAGDVLAAADINDYLMDQAVMVFDSAAARTAGIGTATAGMLTYRADGTALEFYDGSSWLPINASGGSIAATIVYGTLTNATIAGSQITGAISTATIGAANVTTTQTDSAATSYTFASTDAAKLIRFTSASSVVATVGTATGLTAGKSIDVMRDGAGVVRIAAGAGVTFGGAGTAGTAYTIDQYEVATIYCVAANTYRIIGNITAV